MADRLVIMANTLFVGDGSAPTHEMAVVIDDFLIVDIVQKSKAPDCNNVIETDVLVPGLIDLQLNGGGGVQFNDAPCIATLKTMAQAARIGGTAWFLPTFITDVGRSYCKAIAAAEMGMRECLGVIGIHLEGPFLSKNRPGIHPITAIRELDDEDVDLLTQPSIPILLTLAPEEVDESRLERLNAHGIALFIGHSEANYETVVNAQRQGLRGATHLYNAMSQMNNREPGIVGAVFDLEGFFAGIIADGIHVHPANLRNALTALGPERLFLVTDAMSPLGTDAAEFNLLGQRILRNDGRLENQCGTLAGADISMIDAVRNQVKLTGCSLSTAIQMATQTPARAINADSDIGTIEVGKRAGFTHLNAKLDVVGVSYGASLAPAFHQ